MRESGIPLYFKDFEELFKNTKISLVNSFFSANIQFSQQIIQEKISVLEMGVFRIFFAYEETLVFILVASNTASVLLIKERLERIIKALKSLYNIPIISTMPHLIENPNLDKKILDIINLEDEESSVSIIEPIRKLFTQEIDVGEIAAAALFSVKGEIYYSSLPIGDLHTSLKEIEIRSQSQSQDLLENPKLIWQTKEKTVFAQLIEMTHFHNSVYVVLLFDDNTNLGMADYCLEDIITKLHELDKSMNGQL